MKNYIGIGASAVIISLTCFGCGSDQSSQSTSPAIKVVQVPTTRPKPTAKPTPTPTPTLTRAERRRMKAKAKKKDREERRQKEATEAQAVADANKRLSEMVESDKSSDSSEGSSSSGGEFATTADQAAIADLQANSWVKDLYVSPGHMNIGVIRDEKDWSAPMISSYACAVLRKHGSKLNRARFVDIEAVANQGQSPGQAEIYTSACP